MAIKETITDSSRLYHDLQKTGSYKNSFSYDGANALQEYLDELSEDIGEDIEYDPIAWCVEYSEYKNIKEFNNDAGYIEDVTIDGLKDSTTVIEFDGGLIVQDF